MKCQICREKIANIVFTKIVNNEKVILHICSECAKKKGLTIEITSSETFNDKYSTHEPADFGDHLQEDYTPDVICRGCGLALSEFKKTGYFGCDQCYVSFELTLPNILKQIHGSAVHQGKVPLNLAGDIELKKHLRALRVRLQRCIEAEEYERAAELRDKISSIEGKIVKHDV